MFKLPRWFKRFHKYTTPLLGIDIHSSAVSMLALQSVDGHYQVERYAVARLSDADTIEQGILNCVDKTVGRAAIAVPDSMVMVKNIQMDASLSEYDIELQLTAYAERYFPYPAHEMYVDFNKIGPVPGKPEEIAIQVVASRQEPINRLLAALAAVSITVTVVDIESQAYLRHAHWLAQQVVGRTVAFLDISRHVIHLWVLREGECIFSREQQRSEDVLSLLWSDIQSYEIDQLLLSGEADDADDLPSWLETIAQAGRVPVAIVDPFLGMQLHPRIDPILLTQAAPGLMRSCGLAMRCLREVAS